MRQLIGTKQPNFGRLLFLSNITGRTTGVAVKITGSIGRRGGGVGGSFHSSLCTVQVAVCSSPRTAVYIESVN